MPIRPHLNGKKFDPETIRVMGLAYEMARRLDIAAATMSRSVPVSGRSSSRPSSEREPYVVAQLLSDGWCPGHQALESQISRF
jgi:hypothetical protein